MLSEVLFNWKRNACTWLVLDFYIWSLSGDWIGLHMYSKSTLKMCGYHACSILFFLFKTKNTAASGSWGNDHKIRAVTLLWWDLHCVMTFFFFFNYLRIWGLVQIEYWRNSKSRWQIAIGNALSSLSSWFLTCDLFLTQYVKMKSLCNPVSGLWPISLSCNEWRHCSWKKYISHKKKL